MALSKELASMFAKAIVNSEKQTKAAETVMNATIVNDSGKMYAKIDGSDQLTPITSLTSIKNGERVSVLIKDHSATVTGNASDPSASQDTVNGIQAVQNEQGQWILEAETILADTVRTEDLEAVNATIENLKVTDATITGKLDAAEADIDKLTADTVEITGKLTAAEADIDHLTANKIDAEVANATFATIVDLNATNADIHNLEVDYGDFKELHAEELSAINANFDSLGSKYANIDFANIGVAAIEKLFADSGIIGDMIMDNGHVTGTLVGVTIKGDLIEGNTIVADKLVIKGEDGLFYKLNTDGVDITAQQTEYNSLNGSVITANSITAEKINVSDLVAFNATIGGYHITDEALYSGAKTSPTNTTRGAYMDSSGQFAVGDNNNFLQFFKDTDGTWKLNINANSVRIKTANSSKPLMTDTLNQFYQSNSSSAPTGGTWVNEQPAWVEGKYIWMRNLVTYSDGTTAYLPDQTGVCITGNTGAPGDMGVDGNGIKNTVTTYQAGSSQTTAPTGEWSSTIPKLSVVTPYLWIRTVFTYDDDTTSTFYSVSSTLEGVEVGGRNLILKSNEENYQAASNTYPCAKHELSTNLTAGEVYTFTVNATFTNAFKWALYFGGGSYGTSWVTVGANGTKTQSLTFTATADMAAQDTVHFYVRDSSDTTSIGSASCVTHWLKLEKGNKATDWTPAPEDTDQAIDAAIQTSAEQVQAAINVGKESILSEVSKKYYTIDEATGLAELVSDNTLAITQTEDRLLLKFDGYVRDEVYDEAMGTVTDQISVINNYISFDNGDIILGEDGNPVSLKIENDRMAFLDNNTEVMYIDNNLLNIQNAVIRQSLSIGNYEFRPRDNGNMTLVFIGIND